MTLRLLTRDRSVKFSRMAAPGVIESVYSGGKILLRIQNLRNDGYNETIPYLMISHVFFQLTIFFNIYYKHGCNEYPTNRKSPSCLLLLLLLIIIVIFYIAPYSTEIALRRLTFKTQLKHILSSYRSNTFRTQ